MTLTYGLRYELNFPEGERKNRIASFDPATGYIPVADGQLLNLDPTTGALVSVGSNPLVGQVWHLRKTNLAPRVSVSVQPFGPKTTLRAGYGILYNEVTAQWHLATLAWTSLPDTADVYESE